MNPKARQLAKGLAIILPIVATGWILWFLLSPAIMPGRVSTTCGV